MTTKRKTIVLSVFAFVILIGGVFAIKNIYSHVNGDTIEFDTQTKAAENNLAEEGDSLDLNDPFVQIKDGQFQFLSGGFASSEDAAINSEAQILVYVTLASEPAYYTADWQLDAAVLSNDGKSAIYSTFHTQEKIYRIYRYDSVDDTNKVLAEFDISNSPIYTVGHLHMPLSRLSLAPDEQHYFLISLSSDHENFVGLTYNSFVQSVGGGELVELNIPTTVYQAYWFTNYEIAFSGATFGGAEYTSSYVEIYNINTHEVASTKIPVRGAFSGLEPKINPDASAYVYYDVVVNHGYACGGNISNLVIRSYPDDDILFRLDDLHKVSYRWLNGTELEITYTPTPLPLNEYPRRSQMEDEVIQCLEERVMIYQVPE
jgi:hypothetical protein